MDEILNMKLTLQIPPEPQPEPDLAGKYVAAEEIVRYCQANLSIAERAIREWSEHTLEYRENHSIANYRQRETDMEDAILFVKAMAAAPVMPVTFCKDCKFCQHDSSFDYQCWHFRNYGTKAAAVGAMDFCSYGKPKEAENDE